VFVPVLLKMFFRARSAVSLFTLGTESVGAHRSAAFSADFFFIHGSPFTQGIHKTGKGLTKLGMTLAQIIVPRQYEIHGMHGQCSGRNHLP